MSKLTDRRARRGNAALFSALMMMPMALLAGIGIDFGRTYVAQSRLSQAVDAAALAGGRKLSVSDTSVDARAYFDANFAASSEGVTITSFTSTPIDNNNLLKVTAKGNISTTFLKLAGWSDLPIAATATARRTTLGMELALVLDVTGSMDGDPINQLRTAATSLVNILFGDKTSIETLYVSVVPFTASVNFGNTRAAWMTGGTVDATKYAPHVWRGCTEARAAPEDESDTPPVIGPNFAGPAKPFTPFLYKSTLGDPDTKLTDNRWGPAPDAPNDTNNPSAKTAFTASNTVTGPNLGCGQPMAGLDNNRDRIKQIIADLKTSHRNGTIIPVGLQAGWMTLSPKWRGLWKTHPWHGTPTPDGFPLDYNTPYMQKVLLLITDGTNNWYHDQNSTGVKSSQPDYTAYGRINDKRLGASITTIAKAKTELDLRLARMCTTIKSKNIIIYAITTGSGVDASTKTLFSNCATSPQYYYDAPSASQLNTIFTQIGSQLSNLRLEK